MWEGKDVKGDNVSIHHSNYKIMTPLKSDKVYIYNVLPKITKNV